jgi:hypothetical protein
MQASIRQPQARGVDIIILILASGYTLLGLSRVPDNVGCSHDEACTGVNTYIFLFEG